MPDRAVASWTAASRPTGNRSEVTRPNLPGPCDYGPVLLLLDTPSLYFRAFHGIPETMTAPDGMPVNAVRGLIDMTATLVRKLGPDEIVACMDASWRPAFRVAAIPSYKAHRVAYGDVEV